MVIYPAIDIRAGKCVRLTHGDFDHEKVYNDDPVAVAEAFSRDGAEWIHVVDLDGARAGKPINIEVVRRVVDTVSCKVQLGGGIRDLTTARAWLDQGVDRVVVGSALVDEPELSAELFDQFGTAVAAGLDVRDRHVAVSGWKETSGVEVLDLARRVEQEGCRTIVLTDIGRDGALEGPNIDLLSEVANAVSCDVIASGGVSSLDDLRELAQRGEVKGVIVGKALYEGRFTLAEALELR